MLLPTYRYSSATPTVPRELSPDEAVAHLREHLLYHAHNHAFWKARAKALEARLTAPESTTLPE